MDPDSTDLKDASSIGAQAFRLYAAALQAAIDEEEATTLSSDVVDMLESHLLPALAKWSVQRAVKIVEGRSGREP